MQGSNGRREVLRSDLPEVFLNAEEKLRNNVEIVQELKAVAEFCERGRQRLITDCRFKLEGVYGEGQILICIFCQIVAKKKARIEIHLRRRIGPSVYRREKRHYGSPKNTRQTQIRLIGNTTKKLMSISSLFRRNAQTGCGC